ncbi:type II secretion system protein N [Pseudomonadales bacterium]|nr:type II secretion system protein N [Pseudomonadales bacterium]
MRRSLLYTSIGLVAFLGFLITYLPASLVWAQFKDKTAEILPALRVLTIEGSLWHGQADLRVGDFTPSRVTWQLASHRLLAGGLPLQITATGSGHKLATLITLEPSSMVIEDLSGTLQPDYLNQLGARFGLSTSGAVTLENIQLGVNQTWLSTATGRLNWAGGQFIFPDPRGIGLVNLPPLRGHISLQEKAFNLDVTQQNNGLDAQLVSLLLKPDGWVTVAIKARLFKLAQLPWPSSDSLDDTALALEEKLF